MKVPKRILAVAGLAIVGLLGAQAPQAHAVTVAGGVVLGTAGTPGLWTPIAPACGANTCPGGAGAWTLGGTGVGVAVDTTATTVTAPTLTVAGGGTLGAGPSLLPIGGAWCGWSSGSGNVSASVTGVGPAKHAHSTIHWITSAASIIVASGTAPSTIVAVVSALPPTPVLTPGQSCALSGNGSTFTIVGVAVAVG